MVHLPANLFQYWPILEGHLARDLGNHGGFSGSNLWQVSSTHGDYLLRRWPRGQDKSRLIWIHQTIGHVNQCFRSENTPIKLAVPIACRNGQTIVEHGGYLFQVEPWLDGQSCSTPTNQQLQLAMASLARFHNASKTAGCKLAQPPTIAIRLTRAAELKSLTETKIKESAIHLPSDLKTSLLTVAIQVCRSFHRHVHRIEIELNSVGHQRLELIPCLRDIWYAHVLFQNDDERVGLIDYGAMKFDYFGTDVARLAGSFGCDPDRWDLALQSYWKFRDCQPEIAHTDEKLIRIIDRASTLISPMNWIDWVFIENREFQQHDVIVQRVVEYAERMQFWEDSTSEIRY